MLVQVSRGEALAVLADLLGLPRVAPRPLQPLEDVLQVRLDGNLSRKQARCGRPARPQAADWPKMAGARGSTGHPLALMQPDWRHAGRTEP